MSENIKLPPKFRILEVKINKWELLELKYHHIIADKIDGFIKNSGKKLRKKIFTSHIIACTDGLFIIREATKHNTDSISFEFFQGNLLSARKKYKFNKLEHVRLINQHKFYGLNSYTYEQADTYDIESIAAEDFQSLVSNDNLVEDKYIRSVQDVIELGVNQDFERGQLIFRGQISDEWDLIPKLFREHKEDAELIEMALCEDLLLGRKSPYSYTYDPIDHLMNLQHFGIPTRLLDWTSNLLIALFFACYDEHENFNDKDGILYQIERSQFSPYKVNSSENSMFSQPINSSTIEFFKKRLDIDDIHIFEPVIKNPRLRIQDGCFMFFSFLPLNPQEKKFVTFHDFMRAKNEYLEMNKENKGNPISKIWIGHIKIDRHYKKSILKELEKEHGLSKKSLFVQISHVNNVSRYYHNLYEKAKIKAIWIKEQRTEKI